MESIAYNCASDCLSDGWPAQSRFIRAFRSVQVIQLPERSVRVMRMAPAPSTALPCKPLSSNRLQLISPRSFAVRKECFQAYYPRPGGPRTGVCDGPALTEINPILKTIWTTVNRGFEHLKIQNPPTLAAVFKAYLPPSGLREGSIRRLLAYRQV